MISLSDEEFWSIKSWYGLFLVFSSVKTFLAVCFASINQEFAFCKHSVKDEPYSSVVSSFVIGVWIVLVSGFIFCVFSHCTWASFGWSSLGWLDLDSPPEVSHTMNTITNKKIITNYRIELWFTFKYKNSKYITIRITKKLIRK